MTNNEDSTRRWTLLGNELNIDQDEQRGQAYGRLIFGAFILVVVAGPLVTAAVDIQSSLAATPVFTWFGGTVVALLIIAAVVAAVVEGV